MIQTLEDNFPPLKINHYIEVDFKGFRDIVDAIGKIHLWFPTPAHDPYSGLNVNRSGCVSVDGTTALAYARSRHYYIPENPKHPAPWQWNYTPRFPRTRIRGGAGWTATGVPTSTASRASSTSCARSARRRSTRRRRTRRSSYGLLDALSKNFTHDDTLKFDELKALVRTFNRLDPAQDRHGDAAGDAAPRIPGFSAERRRDRSARSR